MKPTMGFSMNRLWLLSSAVALMVLVTWSQLSHIGKLTNTSYAQLIPIRTPSKGPPILAYWILGSRGDNKRIMRLLRAIYHPRNQYLLQLDSASPDHERMELSRLVDSERVFRDFVNVNVVGRSYAINPTAASGLAAVLHAAALLLRVNADWDWFIPLSASDYPILTQDDILYAFSSLPKDVIFMGYDNATSLEKRQNVNQIVVDPSLYLKEESAVYYAVETRENPDAFHIFRGSPWMILTRGFLDHCVNGMDNLPRKLLMYFNNVVFPLESYFQTVLCNTPELQNTTLVNDNLRYTVQNTNTSDPFMASRAIFAGPFREDDPKLQEIDEKLLCRDLGRVVRGKWCSKTGLVNETAVNLNGTSDNFCSGFGDIDSVEAGARGVELRGLFLRILGEKKVVSRQCQSHIMHEETKK